MANFFKAVWSGNIYKRILSDFNADIENQLDLKSVNASPWQTAYGDFNGDGKTDILTSFFSDHYSGKAGHRHADGQLILLLNIGKKGFVDGTDLLPRDGRLNAAMMNPAVADLNGDGIDDIVMSLHHEDGRNNATEFTADQVALFSGANGFEVMDLGINYWGRTSLAADLNNDGLTDMYSFGWTYEDPYNGSSFMFQNPDGSFTQKLANWIGSVVVAAGDFDGDGDTEMVDFQNAIYEDNDPKGFITRLFELDGNGDLISVKQVVEPVFRTEKGIAWSGQEDTFAINKDQNGKEFMDLGLHFSATGDVTGDGADDLIAVHQAAALEYKNGVLHEGAGRRLDHLNIYTATENGLEKSDLKIRGWTYTQGLIADVELVDWNGDGHLDIFVPWDEANKKGVSDAARIFINDGVGNFDRLAQKYIPSGDNRHNAEYGDFVDANGDGIMDVLVRPRGFDESWSKWDKFSETLYLGTKRIASANSVENVAREGAAGFNEDYYLNQLASTAKAMRGDGFHSALDHYLSVGKASGAFGFAAGTHVYGYKGSEVIALREGNESVDALGGDDTITGAAGADTVNGGKGADTFVYLAVTDSGITALTRDVIEDFVSGTDKIDLSAIDAVAGTPANDAFAWLTADGAVFTGKAGELRWYSTGSGADQARILEGDVNGDSIADFQIELSGAGAINVADVML